VEDDCFFTNELLVIEMLSMSQCLILTFFLALLVFQWLEIGKNKIWLVLHTFGLAFVLTWQTKPLQDANYKIIFTKCSPQNEYTYH